MIYIVMNLRRLSVGLLFMFVFHYTYGQTVLMEEKISAYDFKIPKKGPNYRHFSHLYLGFGFFIPDNNEFEVKTKPSSTTALELGWRYKFKLFNWLAIGTGINYINEIFDIKQVENKLVPNNIMHSKEKLRFNNVGSEFYIRLNFGKRGNIVGKFVDIGAYGNWAFKVKHMYVDKLEPQVPYRSGTERVVLYNLQYVEKFNYGLKARIGANRYVLTASYRMNDLLTKEYKTEVGEYYLPKLTVGLEIGMHK